MRFIRIYHGAMTTYTTSTFSRFGGLFGALLAVGAAAFSTHSLAADTEFALAIKNHRFEPTELKVPANQRVRLVVHNQDTTPEEFESHSLNREKIVPPGAKVVIFIGPLKPGRYDFYGEYNEATAKGAVVAE
jgi:heme/copper-type cytochrome/quinol oxidase subunit 2